MATSLLSFIILSSAFSQQNDQISKSDSLANLLKIDKEDTNKLNHLNDLGWELMYQNPDTAILLGEQAMELGTQIINGTLASNNKAVKFAAEKGVSNANANLGAYYYLKGDYSISLQYHFKALELREAINDKNGIAKTLNNIGLVFRFQGVHAQALEYYFKALKLNVELGNKKLIAFNLNNIGLVYFDIHDYKKALDYFQQALQLNEGMENKSTAATNLNNIGNVYFAKGDHPKALEFYFKALKVNEELENDNESANNLGNIGATYFNDKKYPEALEYYTKALKLNEELGNKYLITANLGNIGHVYILEEKYVDAEKYLLKALSISTEIGALEFIKEDNELLSSLYSKTNRYQLAYEHYQAYSNAKDSLFNDDKSKEIGRLEMRHEIEKIERDRMLEEEERIRITKKNRERKNELQYSGMIIGLLIIGLMVILLGFVKVSPPMARSVTFFAFLLFFEFILLVIDPYVEKYSSGEPLYKLLINALLAICIFPLNAILERVIKKRLTK